MTTTIVEVSFGDVTFSGIEIKAARLVEKINPLSTELPINTLELTLFSADGDFSIINPSGFYASLQYKQPLEVYVNLGAGPVYMGKFYLDKWESISENTATFQASDAMGLLDSMSYTGIHSGGEFVEDVIADIMADVDITYNLDSSFTGYRVNGFIKKGTVREALQQLAFAIGAYITCARSDEINILPMELASTLSAYDHTIDDTMKGLGQPIILLPLVTGVEITSHLYNVRDEDDYESLFKNDLEAGTYRIFFGLDVPVWDSFIVTGATNISAGLWHGTYIDISVASPGTVEITGSKYKDAQRVHAVYGGSLPAGTQPNIVEITDATTVAPFLQAGYVYADEVLHRVYDYYQQRYLQKARLYAQNVAPGDSVLITAQSGWMTGIVEQMETDLAGGFISQVEIVGTIVQEIEEPMNNSLINGSFNFAQRQTPGTLTTIATNTYSADRWRVARENAEAQYQRADATGESGLTSKYFGTFKKITNTGKMHIVQIIEGVNSVPLRGKAVIFQAKMKASASKTIRMAILELQNAGTMDTIPGTLITAFGANTVDPTLGANLAIITAAQSKSVTTSWQNFSVSVTVPSNSKNILVAVWTDSQFAANDTLSIAEAGLFATNTVQTWVPRLYSEELLLCQRHYWKTFLPDTGPAQSIGTATEEFHAPAPVAGAATQRMAKCQFPVSMFKVPTLTTYNPSAANAQVRDLTAAADTSAIASAVFTNGVLLSCTGAAGTAVGNALRVHITAEAEL